MSGLRSTALYRMQRQSTPGYGRACPGWPLGYHEQHVGPPPPATSLDHVTAIRFGGLAGMTQWLCAGCNSRKGQAERKTKAGGRSWRTS